MIPNRPSILAQLTLDSGVLQCFRRKMVYLCTILHLHFLFQICLLNICPFFSSSNFLHLVLLHVMLHLPVQYIFTFRHFPISCNSEEVSLCICFLCHSYFAYTTTRFSKIEGSYSQTSPYLCIPFPIILSFPVCVPLPLVREFALPTEPCATKYSLMRR